MDEKKVSQLLGNFQYNQFVGITGFEVIRYALNAELLVRTPVGNFALTIKGEELLNHKISRDELIK